MTRAVATKHPSDDDGFDTARARLVRRGPRPGRPARMTLRALRVAARQTQATIAERTGIAQGDISRIEQRPTLDESELSTLRRYVEALGAELELAVVFPKTGHRVLLAGVADRAASVGDAPPLAQPSESPEPRGRR